MEAFDFAFSKLKKLIDADGVNVNSEKIENLELEIRNLGLIAEARKLEISLLREQLIEKYSFEVYARRYMALRRLIPTPVRFVLVRIKRILKGRH